MNAYRLPKRCAPIHPGEIFLEEFIQPYGITQQRVARDIRVPYQRLNEVVRGRRRLTPATALRSAKYFGTSTGFWIGLQQRVDLHEATVREGSELDQIEPFAGG